MKAVALGDEGGDSSAESREAETRCVLTSVICNLTNAPAHEIDNYLIRKK